LILEEKPRIKTEPSPDGQLLLQVVYHSLDTIFPTASIYSWILQAIDII